jgi:hypothetical protein
MERIAEKSIFWPANHLLFRKKQVADDTAGRIRRQRHPLRFGKRRCGGPSSLLKKSVLQALLAAVFPRILMLAANSLGPFSTGC